MNVTAFAGAHVWALLIASFLPPIVRALNSDLTFLPTLPSKWRLVLVGALTAVGTAVDQIQNGTDVGAACLTALLTGGPSLVIEILHIIGGGDGGGTAKPVHVDAPPVGQSRGPYSASMVAYPVLLGASFVIAFSMMLCGGCAAFQRQAQTALTEAAVYVADAQQVVDVVRAVSNLWFLSHPGTDAQAKVERAIGEVSRTIDVAVRATRGAQDLTQEQLDAAWNEFRAAYRELQSVLQDVGVVNGAALGLSRGPVPIPEPIAMKGRP